MTTAKENIIPTYLCVEVECSPLVISKNQPHSHIGRLHNRIWFSLQNPGVYYYRHGLISFNFEKVEEQYKKYMLSILNDVTQNTIRNSGCRYSNISAFSSLLNQVIPQCFEFGEEYKKDKLKYCDGDAFLLCSRLSVAKDDVCYFEMNEDHDVLGPFKF